MKVELCNICEERAENAQLTLAGKDGEIVTVKVVATTRKDADFTVCLDCLRRALIESGAAANK